MLAFRCSVCETFNRLSDAAPLRCTGCESKLDLSGTPQEVDAPELARAIAAAPVPLLVEFWAPWCAPCLASAPIVQELGARMAGRTAVLAVDTQRAPEAGIEHAIYAIPTFALFQGGEETARRVGLFSRDELERWVRRLVAPAAAAWTAEAPRAAALHA